MKTKVLPGLVIGAAFFLFACNNEPKKQEPTEAAEQQNEQKADAMEDRADQMEQKADNMEDNSSFLVKIADANMKEIELGKLAAKHGQMQDVKNFGKMVADHHSKILEELKGLAASKNITLPAAMSDDNRKAVDEMAAKSGHDFDDKFIDDMEDAHEKSVSEFEDKSDDKNIDADVKTWLAATLPKLKAHLQEIKRIDDKFDHMKK